MSNEESESVSGIKMNISVQGKLSRSQTGTNDEHRDEWDTTSRRDSIDDRDDQSKRQTKPSPSRRSKSSNGPSHPSPHASPHPSPQRHYMGDPYHSYYQPPPGRGPYHGHPGMHGGPRGPPPSSAPFPPPPHYYGGHPDHFRGPPPPHYHGMPPIPHPGQSGHYNGHYCPPPNMVGRPGPPPHNYPPPYGAPYPPPMGYHGGPPPPPPSFHHQGNPPPHMINHGSDSNSISSSKSKSSDRRSIKSQSSNGTRKKRTIDGVHEGSTQDKNMPSAYAFRRSSSSASSTNSTVTAGNNTSIETHTLCEESPHKRERVSSRASSHLPPLSHAGSNIFDEERIQERVHRRSHSGASTASSLSVGGFSLASYEATRGKIPQLFDESRMILATMLTFLSNCVFSSYS
jgi:hypothetical protein